MTITMFAEWNHNNYKYIKLQQLESKIILLKHGTSGNKQQITFVLL